MRIIIDPGRLQPLNDIGSFLHDPRDLVAIVEHDRSVEGFCGHMYRAGDFDEIGYRGPCPPEGDDPHRYEFIVYAIEEATGFGEQAAADELSEAIAGHTIATGTLTATYGRDG